MSSLITHEPIAIRLRNVSKIYRLHGSQGDQLIDVLGLQRFGFKTKTKPKEFAALSNISLDVPRGHRIGIVGRNGAGKTTLLKLICGNFTPTSGELEVNGSVQALMSVGMGFHPEYTGRENIEASLQYNGLAREEYQKAMEGIIDFCELGEFLDQPFKTYSLGMQARLMFAAATAIKPDILIVDEVLGAGDAYFVAKSKNRVQKMIEAGCTMLLVSHSMQQVLELCDEAIWLEHGEIKMRGEAMVVVKAFEEYLQRSINVKNNRPVANAEGNSTYGGNQQISQIHAGTPVDIAISTDASSKHSESLAPARMQVPYFVPHKTITSFPTPAASGLRNLASGGLSRWVENPSLKIIGLDIQTENGSCEKLICLQPARFVLDIEIMRDGDYVCCYGFAIHDHMGSCITRIFSSPDAFKGLSGQKRQVVLILNPCQIGPGEYTLGISVTEHLGIERINEGERYDLLSRSFKLTVVIPDSLSAASGAFLHSAEWLYQQGN